MSNALRPSTALRLSVLGAAAVISLAACSSSTATKAGSTASSAAGSSVASSASTSAAKITIKNFSFSPMSLTVKPGATVTVTNNDSVAHTVSATAKGAFNTMDINAGKTVTFTAPTKAGSYPYICDIHNYMKGTLVVS
jgi:plastocyanin